MSSRFKASEHYSTTRGYLPEMFTCLKYSSAIRLAHSMQYFRGRVGLDTSAHLIIILLINIILSGNDINGF